MSDKTLHYLAYLILVFLWWFAISPYKKVNWLKAKPWLTLAIMACYGAMDEWLQHYVNRGPDVGEFFADFAGALTGMAILTVFSFWPAAMIISTILIFALTNLTKTQLVGANIVTNATFHFIAYTFFTLLWIQHIHRYLALRIGRLFWLMASVVLPAGLLFCIKGCSSYFGKEVWRIDFVTAATGIAAAVLTSWLIFFIGRRTRPPEGFVEGVADQDHLPGVERF